MDENIVLGLFTFAVSDPAGNQREIDVELSTCPRWKAHANDPNNGQYVIQPDIPGHKCRCEINLADYPHETTNHEFTWEENSITFKSYYGNFSSNPLTEDIISTWSYNGDDVPMPGEDNSRINL